MKTRIHLVRHGLSQANLDLAVNRRMPDHAVELAPQGHRQARKAGDFLARHIAGIGPESEGGFHHRRVRLLISPYTRTRQTAEGVKEGLRKQGLHFDEREDNLIREQSFGLFDGLTRPELEKKYPDHYAHYQKHVCFEGEFYASMPLGESRSMVCDRIRGAFGTILRDMSGRHMPPVTDMIVVSHGVSIRCFLKEWLHLPWEWCEKSTNPHNCSITTIEGEMGRGWSQRRIFEGFEHIKETRQEHREDGHIVDDPMPEGERGAVA
jgi:2,3-bisphosphoglycerate-dependent phosphoglycerate mutase